LIEDENVVRPSTEPSQGLNLQILANLRFRVTAIMLFVLLPVAAASGDELRLRNGDRYSGTIVQLSGGTLMFKTPHGALAVPWSEVAALTVDAEIIVTDATGAATPLASGSIDVPNTVALARPRPALELSGGAGAGVVATGGNTSVDSFRLDGDAVVRHHDNRYTFDAEINQAEDRGETTAQNWTVLGRFDRFLNTRLFVNANAIFTDDRFRDIDLRSAYGAGLGYQIVDMPSARLSVDGGIGYVDENFQVAEDDSYAAVRETTKLDVIVIRDRLTVFHQHDGYFGVTGDDNLFVNTSNGVRLTVLGGLLTTLRLDVDYDRSPSPGRRNVDRTFALTLGYRF
jgi:putative salt-induced outer membrane protein YdiY